MAIGELCEGIYDGPHATPKKTESGPIFLGISNLEGGRLNLSSTEHLSEEDFKQWTRRVTPQKDDLVFSYETRLGEVALLPPGLRCCLGRRMALMRFDRSKADPKFMLYAYLSPQFQTVIRSRTIPGSTVDRIPLIEFPKFPIAVPPLPIQRQIASILSAFDDKIELNRRMNRTLEQMARALFKSWFVDFDPVRAKMRGEQPEGMDEATAALFPDELVEIEGREVPKGWEWVTVGDLAQQGKEQISPSAFPQATYAHFSIPAFDAGQQPALEKGESIKSNKFLVPDEAILVSKLNPSTPRIWNVDKPRDVDFCVCSTEFIPLIAKKSEIAPLLYLALSSETFTQPLADQASGTSNSHQRVRPVDITNAPAIMPSEGVVTAFGSAIIPVLEYMKYNIRESARLAQLRDALLPRLLAGEADVSAWEQGF